MADKKEELAKADEKRVAADTYSGNPAKNEAAVDAQIKAADARKAAYDEAQGTPSTKETSEAAKEAKKLERNPGGIETAKDEVANRELRNEVDESAVKLQAHAAKVMDKQPAPTKVQLGRRFQNSIYWERIDDDTEVTVTKDNPAVVPYITGRMSQAIAEGHLEVVGLT